MSNSVFSSGKGVMLNAYPDSIGGHLGDIISLLEMQEFESTFSLFYILPTFFNSDLDRGFSIIDYHINKDLVADEDMERLKSLDIQPKFDIVLNHLSVASSQFKDLLAKGDESVYKDFFIDWNEFWKGKGEKNSEGIIVPDKVYLDKLFMRKSGLPILKVGFPDGSERPYWNTFYQKITYNKLEKTDLLTLINIDEKAIESLLEKVNNFIDSKGDLKSLDLGEYHVHQAAVVKLIRSKCTYLGQMDVNAKSSLVWEYYDKVLASLASHGCKILRLDAFAYLHKEAGMTNFFNKPGTWDYLSKIAGIADKHGLKLLPEIHAEYGLHLHDEVATQGYMIYDFFLPGLMLHAIEKGDGTRLSQWGKELIAKGYKTVNMLGCHDGIPLLDLKGKEVNGQYHAGLLADEEIDEIMDLVISRGGKVKNLYGADGKKISYYQVNATYFSALGEDEAKLLLARAIQCFMPGIPQIWYLDLFAGKNDYEAVERAGADGHKEINRSNISLAAAKAKLDNDVVQKQLAIIKLRNTHPAFDGQVAFLDCEPHELWIKWTNYEVEVMLKVNFIKLKFEISTNGDV
jgi:sucrose phosphorylase